ncbi:MAG: hypothetical protein GX556_16475 [Fibrobacter sp.]|jgi:hypothetical protein|nr:hypothetical protein [Fibrobacter sp.]
MTDTTEKLEQAVQEYMKQHPNADSPLCLLADLGDEGLLKVLKKANGREIVFEDTDGLDEIKWKFL